MVTQTPPVGRKVKIISGVGFRPKTGLKRNDLSRLAKMMIASFIAKFDPIQMRGPLPKGRYAKRISFLASANRSGFKVSGFC